MSGGGIGAEFFAFLVGAFAGGGGYWSGSGGGGDFSLAKNQVGA